TIFLLITGPGIVGNIFVFVNYTCIFFWGTEKFTHLILMHCLLQGMTKTVATFGLRNFLADIGCKLLFIWMGHHHQSQRPCVGKGEAKVQMAYPSLFSLLDPQFLDKHELTLLHLKHQQHKQITK
ncbi:hypothetical protein HPG69_008844, partial [Diceros bicornis minor]